MNYEKLKQFRFWEMCDKALSKERYSGERRLSFYPTEASVIAKDPDTGRAEVIGTCMRKSWYRIMGFEPSNPLSIKTRYILEIGKYIEHMIIELTKLAGHYENNAVKFWDRSNYISGEIDLIAKVPIDNEEHYIFVESKTSWGGQMKLITDPATKQKVWVEVGPAKDLFPHLEYNGKSKIVVNGYPKDSNLLQLLIYLYTHKDDPKLLGGKLLYFLRDNCNRTEFDVVIIEEDGRHRAVVNGEVDKRFYIEDIYARFEQLKHKLALDFRAIQNGATLTDLQPPDRDYTLVYTKEQAKELFEAGKISKTRYNSVLKGQKVGDWQCEYCEFKNLCWNIKQNSTSEEELEEEEIGDKL